MTKPAMRIAAALLTRTTLALVAFALDPRAGASQETVSLEIIRSAMREHVSSITSISTKYRLYFKRPAGARNPPLGPDSWGPQHWEWAEQGSQKLLKSEPMQDLKPPMWMCYNGKAGYSMIFDPADGRTVHRVIQTPEIDKVYYQVDWSPVVFTGLRLPNSDEQLLDLLSRADAKPVGTEIVGDDRCWQVNMGTVRSRSGSTRELAVTFDPSHGYLPRRLSFRTNKTDPRYDELVKSGGSERHFEVLAFQRIHDPLLGRERWFPNEGRWYTRDVEYRIVLDEVLLNVRIPSDRFQPGTQAGAEVTVWPSKPGESTKRYIVGGAPAVDTLMSKRLEESRRLNYPLTAETDLLDARNTGGFSVPRLIFWLSLIILVVAICARYTVGRKAN